MTNLTINPANFAKDFGRVNYARVGIYALILAHLTMSPRGRMSRPGIHSALRAASPYAVGAVDSVIDGFFSIDADGLIYSEAQA